jgi:hypothetical protein
LEVIIVNRIKEFIEKIKRCWALVERTRIIKNEATGVSEVWYDTSKEVNRGICSSFHRIA